MSHWAAVRRFYGPDGTTPRAEKVVGPPRRARGGRRLLRRPTDEQRSSYPGAISGGQRQRTAIARTLALQPDLLLMDEPFSSLDAPTREDLQNLILQLQREIKLTSIIVTHAIEEAAILGRKILVLGQPPNTAPVIVPNPESGAPGFRSTGISWTDATNYAPSWPDGLTTTRPDAALPAPDPARMVLRGMGRACSTWGWRSASSCCRGSRWPPR